MTFRNYLYLFSFLVLSSCTMNYSMTGVDTSGASNFSVDFFRSQTPLASQVFAQQFTESLRDVILTQSPLDLVEKKGDLRYEGSITGYRVAAASVKTDETASFNRLTISIKVRYVNTLEDSKNFEKTFQEYVDYESTTDLFSIEEELWEVIIDKLVQSIYNDSLGNW